MKPVLVAALGGIAMAAHAEAGVYSRTDATAVPFAIVHPVGYDGTGGPLTVKICSLNSELVGPLHRAIERWNQLEPMTGNCPGCIVLGETEASGPYDLVGLLTHELGHCALGLGHSSWLETSRTNTRAASSIAIGADGIEGSFDDLPSPLPGAHIVHWFRKADNDPVKIDATPIDSATYTRRILDLPSGHSWPASANKNVAATLGAPGTQTIMYAAQARNNHFLGLSSDEVNTVKFGMTGIDSVAGTSDDYAITLQLVANCAEAHIETSFWDPPPNQQHINGRCLSRVELIAPETNTAHFRVTNDPDIGPQLYIDINVNKPYDIAFISGFETGDLLDWDGVVGALMGGQE